MKFKRRHLVLAKKNNPKIDRERLKLLNLKDEHLENWKSIVFQFHFTRDQIREFINYKSKKIILRKGVNQ